MSDRPSLLPPNAVAAERAIEQATARIEDVPTPQASLWDPDTCPSELLPWLAWTYSVDRWDATWSDTIKRQVIRDSIAVHRRKGTVGSIRRAIAALGFTTEFTEWWQAGSGLDVHEFKLLVETHGLGITPAGHRVLSEIIDSTKPLRSHMAELAIAATIPPAIGWVGGAPFAGDYTYQVADVGDLPPGEPADGSIGLVGNALPYSVYIYRDDPGAWRALLVYADTFEDLPTEDVEEHAVAITGDLEDSETLQGWIWQGSEWMPLTLERDFARWHPGVANWAGLSAITDLYEGDRAPVADLGNGYGSARWSGSQWELVEAVFASPPDMDAFAQPIRSGSFAVAGGRAYVRHTFAADHVFEGVARDEWLPPYIAARNPFLRQYAVGNEASEGVLEGRGSVVGTSGAATKTYSTTGTYCQIERSGGSSGAMWLAPDGVTAVAGTAYYTRMLARADVPSGYAGMMFLGDGTKLTLVGQLAGSQLTYMTSGALSIGANGDDVRAAMPTIAGAQAPAYVEVIDKGRTRASEIWRNGALYSSYSRNLQAGSSFICGPIVSAASGTVTLQFRSFIGVEFTA